MPKNFKTCRFFAGKFYRNRKISSHKICEDIKVVYDVFIYIVIHLTPIHLMTEVTSIFGLNCKRYKKRSPLSEAS